MGLAAWGFWGFFVYKMNSCTTREEKKKKKKKKMKKKKKSRNHHKNAHFFGRIKLMTLFTITMTCEA